MSSASISPQNSSRRRGNVRPQTASESTTTWPTSREPDEWWDGAFFDGAVCEMAMMDIEDLDGTVNAVAATVRPNGWFLISMVHPCFPGGETGLSSWPVGKSYFDEGRWTSPDHNPDGVRRRVGSSHRTLSTYLNTAHRQRGSRSNESLNRRHRYRPCSCSDADAAPDSRARATRSGGENARPGVGERGQDWAWPIAHCRRTTHATRNATVSRVG